MIATRFVAFDLETGGLDPQQHQVLQIGAAVFNHGVLNPDWFSVQLAAHPTLSVTLGALRITGITEADLASGVDEEEAYSQFAGWLRRHNASDLTVVSHNASFDQAFWSQFVYRQGRTEGAAPHRVFAQASPLLFGPWACTRRMLAAVQSGKQPQTLDNAARMFGLCRESDRHNAVADAVLCGEVYLNMAMLPRFGGVVTTAKARPERGK